MRLLFTLLCNTLAARQALSLSLPFSHIARAAAPHPAAATNSSDATLSPRQGTTPQQLAEQKPGAKVEVWASGTKWPYKFVEALPANSSVAARKFQPFVDFDDWCCYNMPAVDAEGNLNAGFKSFINEDIRYCRMDFYLQPEKNNVYVRRRCNNGWCAWLYAYYFPMDNVYGMLAETLGHQHDWEYVTVWTRHPALEIDGPFDKLSDHLEAFLKSPAHKLEDYETRMIATKGKFYYVGSECRIIEEHPKIVYGFWEDGKVKHSFRPAQEREPDASNQYKRWLRSSLVEYGGIPERAWQNMVKQDWGRTTFVMSDEFFEDTLQGANFVKAPAYFNMTRDDFPNIPQYATD